MIADKIERLARELRGEVSDRLPAGAEMRAAIRISSRASGKRPVSCLRSRLLPGSRGQVRTRWYSAAYRSVQSSDTWFQEASSGLLSFPKATARTILERRSWLSPGDWALQWRQICGLALSTAASVL